MRRLLALVLVVASAAAACSYETKDFDTLFGEDFSIDDLQTAQSSVVRDRNGKIITELRGEQNRTDVGIDDIPELVRNAVIAIEDERFYSHSGVDLKAIFRAARSNLSAGGISQGGSTITQQYVGSVFLDRGEQTGARKIEEIFMARRFEEQFSKDFILQRYLNWVYFGNGAYGVEAAAREYFGSPSCELATTTAVDDRDCLKIQELTLVEAALIAGLIQRPGANNPYDNYQGARDRRDLVLARMLTNEMITADDYEDAVLEPIDLVEEVPLLEQQYEAAYFVEEVKQWFLDNPAFGETRDDRARLLFEGGLEIRTTIDLDLQRRAEEIVERELPQTRADGRENPDASVVVLGTLPEDDGHVLVMVGGRDFYSDDIDAKVNLAAGKGRQAGSSMKPIALAAALQLGIPITSVYPAPSFKVFTDVAVCGTTWRVRGGGGGLSTLAQATRWSRNTVFAQLMIDIGPQRFVDMAEQLGIGEDRIKPVCAAVLGSEDVNMVEMATVFSTFSRSGVRVDPTYVTRIINPDGTLLYQHTPERVNVLDRSVADQVTWALNQVIDNPGTGRRAQLDERPAAGKTGTAQNNADATFMGYTPQRTAAVWVGFPEGQISMRGYFDNGASVQGGTFPARIWGDIMDMVHEGMPVVQFPAPPPSSTTTLQTVIPDSVEVPDLIGRAIDEELLLEVQATTLRLVTADVETSEFAPGTIFNQAPPAGTFASGGATLTVEVAVPAPEPEFETVPDVVGLTEAEARQVLGGSGFGITEDYQTDPEAESPAPGEVWAQSPGTGEEVDFGSIVVIKVNPEPPAEDDDG